MKTKAEAPKTAKKPKGFIYILTTVICAVAILLVTAAVVMQRISDHTDYTVSAADHPANKQQVYAEFDPTYRWQTGYIATLSANAAFCDSEGTPLGTLTRGTQVKYETDAEGKTQISHNGTLGYLQEGAYIVGDVSEVVPPHTLYVRTAVNLRYKDGRLMDAFAAKGVPVEVVGYDSLDENGNVHMYRVNFANTDGYIMPWYLAQDKDSALSNFDGNGKYATHADREDHYGGGSADNLDYYPREKANFEDNVMPDECRTLYLVNWRLEDVDSYIDIANNSGINAFVVDITDGGSIGYASEVMKEYSPSSYDAAVNTVEEYKAAIQKIKDAGYYVIGRITTFNDTFFVKDHPECAILNSDGDPMKLSGEYWPSAYNRYAWQYKVDLAVEAVELMGFNEIQFDYVRFPDRTMSYEEAGTIEFNNTYGETKAQAIQRFLMYATDILHEHGAYVSADVYGESAYTYVTAYGQYWPAISNVVDVISGMPYPDHFGWTDSWKPWEHPYDTLYSWGQSVMTRQSETATPAVVRTWIQAYNAIREPYNYYGPDEVSAQIRGLRDSGCTGGYMTWNAASSIDKYTSLIPAFAEP